MNHTWNLLQYASNGVPTSEASTVAAAHAQRSSDTPVPRTLYKERGMCLIARKGIAWLRMTIPNIAVLRFICVAPIFLASTIVAQTSPPAFTTVCSGKEPTKVLPVRVVVGFMGGRVKPDNLLHKEATLAQDLRSHGSQPLNVFVFANGNGGTATQTVLRLVDQNGDHAICDSERKAVTVAIYGHSWGASEAINLARSLQKFEVPVALTVQVDSVQKPGENDREIPSNVQQAANFFQRDGLLRGRESIYAQDAAKTRILFNEQYHYGADHAINIARFPWFARTFMRQHIMIENDPEVWTRVEDLVEKAIQGNDRVNWKQASVRR